MRISDWSSDVCSSDLLKFEFVGVGVERHAQRFQPGDKPAAVVAEAAQCRGADRIAGLHLQIAEHRIGAVVDIGAALLFGAAAAVDDATTAGGDRKSTRLNSSH